MVKYAYIITLNFGVGGSYTRSGDIDVQPGDTRLSLYRRIVREACDKKNLTPEKTSAAFFYLEPMELNAVDLADLME